MTLAADSCTSLIGAGLDVDIRKHSQTCTLIMICYGNSLRMRMNTYKFIGGKFLLCPCCRI
jgi:hypothetical protein